MSILIAAIYCQYIAEVNQMREKRMYNIIKEYEVMVQFTKAHHGADRGAGCMMIPELTNIDVF